MSTVRLQSSSDSQQPIIVDLLFASSGIEFEIVESAELLEMTPNFLVPVATVGHLIAVKLLARDDRTRPQDLMDLHSLIAIATQADLVTAREAINLITERGFNRERDLSGALDELLVRKANL